MDNQKLIAKLNNLKEINPDAKWLASNRELLLSQVSNSGAENISVFKATIINFSSFTRTASQPVFALGVFIVLLLSGGLMSQSAFLNIKPNDSLYIARIISEKLKINTTFNTQDRNKLAMQYAAEHAQDINNVLADPSFNNEANKNQVAKLNDSFKEEMITVQARINNLSVPIDSVVAISSNLNNAKSNNVNNASLNTKNQETNNNDSVVIADSARDNQGIQLLDNSGDKNKKDVILVKKPSDLVKNSSSTASVQLPKIDLASSSSETSSKTILDLNSKDTGKNSASKILDEAQKLFDQKNYDQVSKKLKEVEAIIK